MVSQISLPQPRGVLDGSRHAWADPNAECLLPPSSQSGAAVMAVSSGRRGRGRRRRHATPGPSLLGPPWDKGVPVPPCPSAVSPPGSLFPWCSRLRPGAAAEARCNERRLSCSSFVTVVVRQDPPSETYLYPASQNSPNLVGRGLQTESAAHLRAFCRVARDNLGRRPGGDPCRPTPSLGDVGL